MLSEFFDNMGMFIGVGMILVVLYGAVFFSGATLWVVWTTYKDTEKENVEGETVLLLAGIFIIFFLVSCFVTRDILESFGL